MKKGFTLIELLAVIVILAIILLIAIPIVQKTIQDAKVSSNKASIDLYGRSADQAIERYQMINRRNPESFADIEEYIEYSGNEVVCSTRELNSDMTVYLADCIVGDDEVEEYTYGAVLEKFIYMWYTGEDVDGPSLDEIINPSDYSQTVPSDKNYYLKFKLDKTNKVTEGYACAVFDGTTYCVQGGNPDYYGWVTDKDDSTGNVAIINSIQKANPSYSCAFSSGDSYCRDGSVYLNVISYGIVSAHDGVGRCNVSGAGSSYCVSS